MDRLEADAFPVLGQQQIAKIDGPAVLAMLRKIEDRGAITMAARVKEHCSQIFCYALLAGKCSRDPTVDLKRALRPAPAVKHHTVVRFDELPQLLRDIDAYHHVGEAVTRLGLQLAMLTLVRTQELIKGEWSQIEGLCGATMKVRTRIASLDFAPEGFLRFFIQVSRCRASRSCPFRDGSPMAARADAVKVGRRSDLDAGLRHRQATP